MRVVVLYGVVETYEGIKATVGGRVLPFAEAQMPFACHVSAVAQLR